MTTTFTSSTWQTDVDYYSPTAVTVTSLSLNVGLFVLLLTRVTARLVRTYEPKSHPTMLINHKVVQIITDEILNTILIGLAVYCSLALSWPRDYMKDPPLPLLTLVCSNLARYILRIVAMADQQPLCKHMLFPLIHHLVMSLLLVSILVKYSNWWLAVVLVFMEMNSILRSIRKLVEILSYKYWVSIASRFAVIELISVSAFKFVLPVVLLAVYYANEEIRVTLSSRVFDLVTTGVACVFFGVYHAAYTIMYCKHLLELKRNPLKAIRQRLVGSTNKTVMLNSVPLPQHLQPPKQDIKADSHYIKNCTSSFNMKRTDNVNTDSQVPSQNKLCEKVLLADVKAQMKPTVKITSEID